MAQVRVVVVVLEVAGRMTGTRKRNGNLLYHLEWGKEENKGPAAASKLPLGHLTLGATRDHQR